MHSDTSGVDARDPGRVATADLASRVRFAERCDFDELLALCRGLHLENGLFEMSMERVASVLMKHFNRDGGIIGVIGPPGRIEGMITMQMSQMWYSEQWLIEELFSYVAPEYRRSDNAKALVAFAMQCSERIGLPLLIGIISNERTEAKTRLYRRVLGNPAGSFFMFDGAAGHDKSGCRCSRDAESVTHARPAVAAAAAN